MTLRPSTRRIGRFSMMALSCLASALIGAAMARGPAPASALDHPPHPAGVKAPVAEVLHCPLAFAGVHLQKDRPSNAQVAYHYCKSVNDDVAQCLLYDGTGPDARLIGVEYLVGGETYRKMPDEEKAYWHDHEFEVDSGLLKSLTQHGDEEKQTLAKVRTLYGKITHTWVEGKDYPEGPSKLFWAVTGKAPFVAPADSKLPPEARKPGSPAKP